MPKQFPNLQPFPLIGQGEILIRCHAWVVESKTQQETVICGWKSRLGLKGESPNNWIDRIMKYFNYGQLCGPMGQSLKGKSSPFKDRYRFESCKTQDHEVISPLKRKPYSFSQGLPPWPAARIITIFPLKIFWQSQGKTKGKIVVISQKQKLPARTNFQKVPTRTNFQPKPSVSAHGAKKAAPLRHPQLHKPNHHACPLGQQGDPVHGMIAQKKSSQMKKWKIQVQDLIIPKETLPPTSKHTGRKRADISPMTETYSRKIRTERPPPAQKGQKKTFP